MLNSKTNFTRYAWLVLAFNVLVILWGAVVSSTGSGAGCGDHWPLCDGEVIPRDPSLERMIEFSHRATSGVALLMVFGLAAWAFRLYTAGHRVRRGAVASVIVIIVESLLGAGLVLFRWTAMDTSAMRVVIQPIHMLNTLILLGTILLTAWWASGGQPIAWRAAGERLRWFVLGGLSIWLMSATGSIISLGDLLAIRLGENYNALVEVLVRLRLGHPAISILAGLFLLWLVFLRTNMAPNASARRWSWAVAGLVAAQWSMGLLNVLLLVPLWTQLAHLLLADFMWIAFLLWTFNALAEASVAQAMPASAVPGAASAD
ncbi:MAG: COX15/CtaA family protein [Anaerolineales bacterium]|nr:COX15/CtaA family protein [Anaerolineales bacterium]